MSMQKSKRGVKVNTNKSTKILTLCIVIQCPTCNYILPELNKVACVCWVGFLNKVFNLISFHLFNYGVVKSCWNNLRKNGKNVQWKNACGNES